MPKKPAAPEEWNVVQITPVNTKVYSDSELAAMGEEARHLVIRGGFATKEEAEQFQRKPTEGWTSSEG